MLKGVKGALVLLLLVRGAIAGELTLDEAVSLALKHNTDIANSVLDISKAKDRARAFRSFLFPKFSFYALGSEQLTPVDITIATGTLVPQSAIGPIPDHDVKYSTPIQPTGFLVSRAAQPLSSLYRVHLTLKALDISAQLAQQKARGKRQDVVRNVKQLYYNIAQAQSSLDVARESIQLYKEVERLTEKYVLEQTALKSQLLQAQASLANAEQSELVISNQQATPKGTAKRSSGA